MAWIQASVPCLSQIGSQVEEDGVTLFFNLSEAHTKQKIINKPAYMKEPESVYSHCNPHFLLIMAKPVYYMIISSIV